MIYSDDISGDLRQCDIFKDIEFTCEGNSTYYSILITPTCDLVIQEGEKIPKAKYLKFTGIVSFENTLNSIFSILKITKSQRNGTENIDESTFNDLITILKQFIHGSIFPRYYYLPPLGGYFSHSVIDFQLIETKKYTEDLHESLVQNKIARIVSSWRESIPVRYSNYTSRIGVEDISEKAIENIFIDYSLNFSRSS